jgi:1,4-alpha-glucan branching enzyme
VSYLRRSPDTQWLLVIGNFTPVPRYNYRLGVPTGGAWREVLNSDARIYGGSGQGNLGVVESAPVASHGHYNSLSLTLPPLSVVIFEPNS